MKNNLKIAITGILATIALSSCLGDSDSKLTSSGFAYIKKQDGQTVASVNTNVVGMRYLVTSTDIQDSKKLATGMCAQIEFEINNPNTEGINQAVYARVKNEEMYSSASPLNNMFTLTANKPHIPEGKEFYPSAFSISDFNPVKEVLNDNWKCMVQPGLAAEDRSRIKVHFVYDANQQYEEVTINKEIVKQNITDPNKLVIDVYFEKDSDGTEGFQPIQGSTSSSFVASLGNIRNMYSGRPSTENAGYKWYPVNVKFRYTQRYREGNEYKNKVIYLGTWTDRESTVGTYFFYYERPS